MKEPRDQNDSEGLSGMRDDRRRSEGLSGLWSSESGVPFVPRHITVRESPACDYGVKIWGVKFEVWG